MYSDCRFKNEDKYEMMKVQKVVRTHIFKHVELCKRERTKSAGNHFEKKNAKILLYGKSNEKTDLSK